MTTTTIPSTIVPRGPLAFLALPQKNTYTIGITQTNPRREKVMMGGTTLK